MDGAMQLVGCKYIAQIFPCTLLVSNSVVSREIWRRKNLLKTILRSFKTSRTRACFFPNCTRNHAITYINMYWFKYIRSMVVLPTKTSKEKLRKQKNWPVKTVLEALTPSCSLMRQTQPMQLILLKKSWWTEEWTAALFMLLFPIFVL